MWSILKPEVQNVLCTVNGKLSWIIHVTYFAYCIALETNWELECPDLSINGCCDQVYDSGANVVGVNLGVKMDI